jgi:hypothetical protein
MADQIGILPTSAQLIHAFLRKAKYLRWSGVTDTVLVHNVHAAFRQAVLRNKSELGCGETSSATLLQLTDAAWNDVSLNLEVKAITKAFSAMRYTGTDTVFARVQTMIFPMEHGLKAKNIQAHTDEIASGSTAAEIEDRNVLVRATLVRQIIMGYAVRVFLYALHSRFC